jgi:UDP-N-acetyl-D-glucosamine dehydrogenase
VNARPSDLVSTIGGKVESTHRDDHRASVGGADNKKISPALEELRERIESRSAIVGVCGMGYVGLPLAAAAARASFTLIGFDVDEEKTEALNKGETYIDAVSSDELVQLRESGRFGATCDFSRLSECDVIVVCVPTPLTKCREPDLSFVESTSCTIAANMRAGQLIIIESTTYPGTTDEVVAPALVESGLTLGVDFLLGYSPEREDPGNKEFHTGSIPKIVASDGPFATETACRFYSAFVEQVVPVSTTRTAEAVKLTENIFRAVNIALVNELKVIYSEMGIDVWEVIEAAKTKPFGYMPFYPGPGLGGHCIPIDPFYLTWKSREYDLTTRFIELAGDIRESPALKVIELLEGRSCRVDYHDPVVPKIPKTRDYAFLEGRRSVPLDGQGLASYDAVIITTDHDAVDYTLIEAGARLIVDTRNIFARKGLSCAKVIKA